MKLCPALYIPVLLASLAGCALTSGEEGTLYLEGTVSLVTTDGGGWGLSTAEDLYELVGLPEAYSQDGQRVQVRARPRPDMYSTAMVGPIIEVLAIRRL